jgi:hypothetical protein
MFEGSRDWERRTCNLIGEDGLEYFPFLLLLLEAHCLVVYLISRDMCGQPYKTSSDIAQRV